MNVGTPHTVCESTYAVCSFSTVASGRPLSTSAQTAVDVDAGAGEHRRQVVAIGDRAGGGVAVLEQGVVGVEEHVGLGVADGDRRLQGEQAGVGLGPLPHRRLALGDVGLAERERQQRDLPVGAGAAAR